MKKLFIESRYEGKIDLSGLDEKLPKELLIFTTVQYLNYLDEIILYLKNLGISAKTTKLKYTKYPGQVLGCSVEKIKTNIKTFLYIGDGVFHPTALAIKNQKEVIIYNPKVAKITQVDNEYKIKIEKKIKGGILKFLTSNNIGFLITTKIGQHNSKIADNIIEKYPDKKYFKFAADTFDSVQLENFTFIDCFVNTACPRISYDGFNLTKTIVNAKDILNID